MGYWATSLSGASLQLVGDLNPDGSEMLWGDAPADAIDGGLDRLIHRLRADLGRWPTVDEVDAVKRTAPEMVEAVAAARRVFTEDVEREPTDGEIEAGLAFSDTGLSLDSVLRADIAVGDTVRWAVMRNVGGWQEVDHTAEGVVSSIEERTRTNGWSGRAYTAVVYVVDGVDVDRAYAHKVLPGDKPVEVENAEREERRRRDGDRLTGFLPDEDEDDSGINGGFGLIYNRNPKGAGHE